ncbi:MAG: hypothetical protein INR62_04760 [Rhodospirillales bacterium]|nr:hypothetical protein [Acetobacter sp.]
MPAGLMWTYVFRPAAACHYPGVVLFSEIFQVTTPIHRTAALLARHRVVVAVPEVYRELEPAGTVLAYNNDGADWGSAHKTKGTGQLRCRYACSDLLPEKSSGLHR